MVAIGRYVDVSRRSLARDIAMAIGFPTPPIGNGSSLGSLILDPCLQYFGLPEDPSENQHQQLRSILEKRGETYEPFWDGSGGSTITNQGLRKLLTVATGLTPTYVYVLGRNLKHLTDAATPYKLLIAQNSTRGIKQNAESYAARGSIVLFYSPSDTGGAFLGHGQVASRTATAGVTSKSPDMAFCEYLFRMDAAYDVPVRVGADAIANQPATSRFFEVTSQTAAYVFKMKGYSTLLEDARPVREVEDLTISDFNGRVSRVTDQFDLPEPETAKASAEALRRFAGRTKRERDLDRLAEARAVEIVMRYLESLGWEATFDRQREGVGYDLEFARGSDVLHAEIKGIHSTRLAFNMTARELERANEDESFQLFAVTSVLTADKWHIHEVDASAIQRSLPRALQYRVDLRSAQNAP